MSEPKFKAGQQVFLNQYDISAEIVKIESVMPKRRFCKQKYIVYRGKGWHNVVTEDELFEVQS